MATAFVALASPGRAQLHESARSEPGPPAREPQEWRIDPRTGQPINPMTGLPLQCETIAHFGDALYAMSETLYLGWVMMGSALVPQSGVRVTPGALQPWDATLSWPISIPFGPATSVVQHEWRLCEREQRVEKHRGHRLLIEPGIAFPSRTTGFVRLGYRFIEHRASKSMGFGGGVGSTLELFAPTVTPRPSIGVEAVLHVGECCRPGYVNVVARYDRFFAGLEHDVLTFSVGLAFF
jgi:hypothetical protein